MFRTMRRRALVINRHQEACASARLDFLEGCCCCGSVESQMAAAKYDFHFALQVELLRYQAAWSLKPATGTCYETVSKQTTPSQRVDRN